MLKCAVLQKKPAVCLTDVTSHLHTCCCCESLPCSSLCRLLHQVPQLQPSRLQAEYHALLTTPPLEGKSVFSPLHPAFLNPLQQCCQLKATSGNSCNISNCRLSGPSCSWWIWLGASVWGCRVQQGPPFARHSASIKGVCVCVCVHTRVYVYVHVSVCACLYWCPSLPYPAYLPCLMSSEPCLITSHMSHTETPHSLISCRAALVSCA